MKTVLYIALPLITLCGAGLLACRVIGRRYWPSYRKRPVSQHMYADEEEW